MQVILHAGAHCTDEDRLLRTLLKNQQIIAANRVAVPRPSAYRKLLIATMNALNDATPAPNARDVFLQAILDPDAPMPNRLILSAENFFTVPKQALGHNEFYPRADSRIRNLRRLFPQDDIRIFLGLRNPATWLPATFEKAPHGDFLTFLNGCEADQLRWSDLILRMRKAAPDIPITTWCNEDSPLLWGHILRVMMGLEPGRKIKGAFDLMSEIITPEGMKRFRTYLAQHPDLLDAQKRRVMVAFIEKFSLPETMEVEVDIPGWTEDFVDSLTDSYDDDTLTLPGIPGVELLLP